MTCVNYVTVYNEQQYEANLSALNHEPDCD